MLTGEVSDTMEKSVLLCRQCVLQTFLASNLPYCCGILEVFVINSLAKRAWRSVGVWLMDFGVSDSAVFTSKRTKRTFVLGNIWKPRNLSQKTVSGINLKQWKSSIAYEQSLVLISTLFFLFVGCDNFHLCISENTCFYSLDNFNSYT